ncbi:hypothetical protein J6590_045358 [Homalodisca vitripennis]|nr:hypothetical protein J6590_045358 [Homalodisca vitripennis]
MLEPMSGECLKQTPGDSYYCRCLSDLGSLSWKQLRFADSIPDVTLVKEFGSENQCLVCIRLKPQLLERSYQELEGNFRSYSRALIGLACNLHRSRELRGLFIDLLERCVEPWRQVSWSQTDLRNFLTAYYQCALEMDILREAEVKLAWERFMNVVTKCLLRMYHS